MILDNSFIAHHGRLGQKWGQRNGPPYPLYRKGNYSAAERKGGKKYPTDKMAKTKDGYTRKERRALAKSKTKGLRISDDAMRMSEGLATSTGVRYHRDDDPNEHELGYYFTDYDGTKKRISTRMEDLADNQTKELSLYVGDTDDGREDEEMWLSPMAVIKDNPDHDKILKTDPDGGITDEMLSGCNPTWDNGTNAYSTNNCGKCTFALEMRKRGYDVSAGRSIDGVSYDAQTYWWKNAPKPKEFYGDNGEEDAMKEIESYGKDTSGEIRVAYNHNGNMWGHSMHWTVDKNGKFEIQDGQEGKRYSSFDDFYSKTNPYAIRNCVNVTRLDNCEPNYEAATNDSCIRENPKNKNVRESGFAMQGVVDGRYGVEKLIDDSYEKRKGYLQEYSWVSPDTYVKDLTGGIDYGRTDSYKAILDNYDLGDEANTSVDEIYDPYKDQY